MEHKYYYKIRKTQEIRPLNPSSLGYDLTTSKNNDPIEIIVAPPKLKHLICNNINIYNLDVTNCIELEYLFCHDNYLTELDLTNCNKLIAIDCRNNYLTKLDLSNCKYLKEVNCTHNKKLKEVFIPNECKVYTDPDVTINYIKKPLPNQPEQQISNLILKIKNPVLWSIADQLTRNLDIHIKDKETTISTKEVKKIANSNQILNQMLSKKEGNLLIKSKMQFNIIDIESLSFELENKDSLFQNKYIELGFSRWNGMQRYFEDEVNYVFQVNLKPFKNKEILDSHPNSTLLNDYRLRSNHPTATNTLTLAWVRYTYSKEQNAIILDEIQTDLNGGEFNLGEELMSSWEEFTMKTFIQYVRKQYKVRKIYMPTYDTRTNLKYYPQKDKDTKLPPMYLYKELPNKFGFKKNSDMDGFMVLENSNKLFESFKDYLKNYEKN